MEARWVKAWEGMVDGGGSDWKGEMRGKEGLRKLRCGWRGSREVGAEGVKVEGERIWRGNGGGIESVEEREGQRLERRV